MKPAKEWSDNLCDWWNYGGMRAPELEGAIRKIQADAIREAATIAREINDGHDWPVSRRLDGTANCLDEGEL